MKASEITTTQAAQESFYPTPRHVAEKLLEGLDWRKIKNVLEPSAGKGDLIDVIAEKHCVYYSTGSELQVDCVESDPYLRSILKYNFGAERLDELRTQINGLRSKENVYIRATDSYAKLTPEEEAQKLLRKTNLSIGKIAESVGYQNNTHFGRLFKKATGISPLAYRKQCSGENAF